MKYPWQIWTVYGVALALVSAAMISLTLNTLALDRAESQARVQAALEENARLALWRLDSTLTNLVAQENARPYFSYSAFYSLERAYGNMLSGAPTGKNGDDQTWAPSVLFLQPPPEVAVYFQIDPQNHWTSPQLPDAALRQARARQAAENPATRRQLEMVEHLVDRQSLLDSLPTPPATAPAVTSLFFATPDQKLDSDNPILANSAANAPAVQAARNQNEFNRRVAYATENTSQALQQNGNPATASADILTGPMQPRWQQDHLLLARRVKLHGQDYVQGCLLDWPAIRQQSLALVHDLLPNADLRPALDGPSEEQPRRLASLPLLLEAGVLPMAGEPWLSPTKLSLLVAWGCLTLAALAMSLLLQGVSALSQRRATFVSAVTHELRTPLTTFRMYAEMLADNMVPDEAARHKYLNTLRVEADRLTHLVENVLAYSGLERGRPSHRLEAASVGTLVERISGRLIDRAEQAGFELEIEIDDPTRQLRALVDPTAVEQILFNLVDNACKYGGGDRTAETPGAMPRILLAAEREGDAVVLRVRDFGPGIAPAERRRLFRAFTKSAAQAATSAPGVGLGLALSRRLARDLGGQLQYEPPNGPGACFALHLVAAD